MYVLKHLAKIGRHLFVPRFFTQELLQLRQYAELGKLYTGLVHEISNPLTTATLNLESLTDQPTKSRDHPIVRQRKIAAALISLKHIQHIIQASKLQVQHQEENTFFSVNSLIQETAQLFHFKFRKNRVQLLFQSRQKLFLFGNPIKFSQVVSNLIANAVDAYEAPIPGEINKHRQVKVTAQKYAQHIVIKVQDWGQGIEAKNLKKIFRPFFSTKTTEQGMGLGLSIIKHIIEHDFRGQIDVQSERGKGSVFTVTFPAQTK